MRGGLWGLALAPALAAAACGSGGGQPGGSGAGGSGGGGGSSACVELAPTSIGIAGVDDTPGMLEVVDLRADATGPFVLASLIQGGVANQTSMYIAARQGGAPTAVYAQGNTIPEGAGLYVDGSGGACAIVSTSTASYVQCAGGAQRTTGLGAIATSQSFFSASRIVATTQSDATVAFFTYGRFAALYGVMLQGSTFSPVEIFESSISFPGAAATAGGIGYARMIGSDDALGVAALGAVVARTRDGQTYRDCRMASGGSTLHVVGVSDTQAVYAAVTPSPIPGGSASTLAVAPLVLDATTPFDVVFFGGKPGLVQLGADGTLQLRDIATDGSLGTPRALATGVDGWNGLASVGPDGGLHLVFDAGGHVSYAKRCP